MAFVRRGFERGVTIEKAAERCGVDPTTAFRWRHRFLKAFSADMALELSGIAEADETFSLESFKGQLGKGKEKRKTRAFR